MTERNCVSMMSKQVKETRDTLLCQPSCGISPASIIIIAPVDIKFVVNENLIFLYNLRSLISNLQTIFFPSRQDFAQFQN